MTIRQFGARPRQLAVSGSSGPGQSVPGLEKLLDARMEELLQASRAPSTLKAYSGLWREFASFATDFLLCHQPTHSTQATSVRPRPPHIFIVEVSFPYPLINMVKLTSTVKTPRAGIHT